MEVEEKSQIQRSIKVSGKAIVFFTDEGCFRKLVDAMDDGVEITRTDDEADLLLDLINNRYQAVIYDLENSRLDGVKMVQIIRRIRPKIPLLVISHDSSRELGGRILQEGVTYYTTKPIEAILLKEAIIAATA